MKLVCSQSDLNANLSLVARAVPSRPTHPVLAHILLSADPDSQKVTLRAFDLSLGIMTSFSAQVDKGGTLTLPAKLLGDIVSRLSEGEIEITDEEATTEDSGIVALVATSGRYQFRTMDALEFPDLPQIGDREGSPPQTLILPAKMLTEGLRATLFAASTEETKQVLTGVHLACTEMELEFAATDGHRLAVVSLDAEEWQGEEEGKEATPIHTADVAIEVTIPAKALRELERLLSTWEGADVVELSFDDSQVAFELGGRGNNGLQARRLTSRKLEGAYPAYDRLIPKEFALSATIDRKQLIAGVERVAVLTDAKNHVVKFSLNCEESELELSVDTIDVGKAREFIPVQISGESIEVAFNVKYLMDGLKALPASDIQMQMNAPQQPVIFTPLGGVKMTYLVMPVQLRD